LLVEEYPTGNVRIGSIPSCFDGRIV